MPAMICNLCNRTGIRWVGPLTSPTGTECPHLEIARMRAVLATLEGLAT